MAKTTDSLTPPCYYSAGKLMTATQLPVPTIRQVLADRGIRPAFFQDDIDFYEGIALLELKAFLREQQ